MNTQKSFANGAELAVTARGNGFYYAIRRFVGEAIAARRKSAMTRHTAEEMDRLPDYLQQDVNWPATSRHEER